jgi:hypothetical protein
MNISVSFHKEKSGRLYNSLKKFFWSDEEVEVYGRNLLNHTKGKSVKLLNYKALDRALSYPDLTVILLSKEYLSDGWLRYELLALSGLEQYRNKKLILPVPCSGIRLSDIPKDLKERLIPSIDFRRDEKKGMEALASFISKGAFTSTASRPKRVFIGHGRSADWKDLKEFLQHRLHLTCEDFESVPSAGKSIKERLLEMLGSSDFAFLVMTAEDEHADKSLHARENVIHEAGLFQGKLGFERAIILLDEECAEFSNKSGLVHIPFRRGRLKDHFEDIRQVLEREKII